MSAGALLRAGSARALSSEFAEIHLHASPAVLATRVGADGAAAYEPPVQPELRLDTGRLTLDDAGAEILAWLREWSSQT